MDDRPRYSGIFEFIERKYSMKEQQPTGSIRYRELIVTEQYDQPPPEPAPERREFPSPAEATEWVKAEARALGADLVGVTRMRPEWVFESSEVEGDWAILLGVRMDFREIMSAPDLRAGVETTRAYYALGHITLRLAELIAETGHRAWPQHPRHNSSYPTLMLFIPHAVAAGLGRHGRSGLLLTDSYGPCVRLSAVTTDLDLEPDASNPTDVYDTCIGCFACIDACDGDAIPESPQSVRDVEKYPLDQYACAPHFAKYDGCSKCIAACPLMERYPDELRDERPWTPEPRDGSPLP